MNDLLKIVERFEGKKICVIGDIIADVFVFGRPYRLSREAPVVVVKYEGEKVFPGSAGNTVNNLVALGAYVYPIGTIGKDEMGQRLMEYFLKLGRVDPEGIIVDDRMTTTKTRILAGDKHTSKQQVIRIDRIEEKPPSKKTKKKIVESIFKIKEKVDAFIVSDYGHGVVDRKVIEIVRGFRKEILIVGDSRYNLSSFRGFTIITPNEQEATELLKNRKIPSIEALGKKILKMLDLRALLITRGNLGMALFTEDGKVEHIPISGKDEVTDVTGAGDTVCAALTLSLATGADFYSAAKIANFAAGIVVMKRGTAVATRFELKEAIKNHGKDST
ncbi:MAG: bifunctional ADP-heptose synthase [Desulfobacterota bacterium]|nr:bifunctional ADP-heptose synthase [Thermodesulfobacteriota bacterium]